MIKVHKAKFVDSVREIDLREDYTGEFTLAKVEEPPPAPIRKTAVRRDPPKKDPPKKDPPKKDPPVVKKVEPPPTPAAPSCQPPGQLDPFDTRPPCKS
jgi:hypothetical protein